MAFSIDSFLKKNPGEPIMKFEVSINKADCSDLVCKYGSVTFIPFTATVDSELFCGTTVPGGCDIQVENLAGSRHMCARYMFRGTDCEGNACSLFVDNNGYLNETMRGGPFIPAYPRFMTDSPVLGEYFSQQRFRSEVHGREGGVEIRIVDVLR